MNGRCNLHIPTFKHGRIEDNVEYVRNALFPSFLLSHDDEDDAIIPSSHTVLNARSEPFAFMLMLTH